MPSIQRRFEPPENWQDFEKLILVVLQRRWQCPELELFGRRGQKQYGVDIVDLSGKVPLRAAQCKEHDPTKEITETELRTEISKAKSFPVHIDVYAIVTTAQKSTTSQLALLNMNRELAAEGSFTALLITWEEVSQLLNEHSDIADQFYGGIGAQTAARIEGKLDEVLEQARAVSAVVAVQGPSPEIESEILEAKQHFEQRQFAISRLLLQRLRERSWDKLDKRQKFRVLSNLGATRLEEGDAKIAAQLFLEAKLCQPEDQLALENEVLAYVLLGDGDTSERLASSLREKFPLSARGWSVHLDRSPLSSAELQKEIPSALADSLEVSLAMARRSLREREFSLAENYARVATRVAPNRSYPWWLLGQALLSLITQGSAVDQRLGVASQEGKLLEEAKSYFEKANHLAHEEKNSQLEALALIGDSFASEILGKKVEAERAIDEAYSRAPDDPPTILRQGLAIRARGDISGAIAVLRKLRNDDSIPEGKFVLAESLSKRAEPADLEESLALCKEVVGHQTVMQPGLREHAISCAFEDLQKLGRTAEAGSILEAVPNGVLSSVALDCAGARLATLQGDPDSAKRIAQGAKPKIADNTSREDIRDLANLLNELGLYAQALPLWQLIGVRATICYDTQELLNCAGRLGRDDIVLDLCRRLRENGIEDPQIRQTEINLLLRYDVDEAVSLLTKYVEGHPDDRSAKLRLSSVGLRCGRPDVVWRNPNDYPLSETVSSQEGAEAVWVLRNSNNPDLALRYAYRLLRRHFGDVDAARAFRSSMDPFGPAPAILDIKTIQPGAAVRFAEVDRITEQWIVIEECDEPDTKLNEISPSDPLAARMFGKQVGEEFVLAQGQMSGTERTAVVRQVTNKYIFRYQQVVDDWGIRYQSPEIEAVRMPLGSGPEAANITLAPIARALERREEVFKELEDVYRSQPASIHEVGVVLGLNDVQALANLAERDTISIRCCDGSADEIKAAHESLSGSSGIVIDLVAIATLMMLDRPEILRTSPVPVTVAQSVMAVLQQMHREAISTVGSDSGSLRRVDGRLVMVDVPAESKKNHAEFLERWIETIKSSCRVVGALSLAYLDPEERNALIAKFGNHGAQSIVLAASAGSALWTDDYILAAVAKQRFGVRRVWTQVAIQWRAKEGSVDPSVFYDATSRLMGWQYSFTSPNTPALLKTVEIGESNPNRWPLFQALRLLASESIGAGDASRLAADFIVNLYRQSRTFHLNTAVLLAVLDAIAKRPDGNIFAIREAVPRMFGLDLIACDEVVRTIDSWLAQKKIFVAS